MLAILAFISSSSDCALFFNMYEVAVTAPATITARIRKATTSAVGSKPFDAFADAASAMSKPIGANAAPIGTIRYTGL